MEVQERRCGASARKSLNLFIETFVVFERIIALPFSSATKI
jgi:hypothetical protein